MVTVKPFGSCKAGDISLITLSDASHMTVEFLSLGATVRSIIVPDKNGTPTDVSLGYESLEEYWNNDGYVGACVGRYANRIGNSRFTLNGREWKLCANEGKNQLHGGVAGFDKKNWSFTHTEYSVTFTLVSPHLEEGFPGELHVEVTYSLEKPGQLDIHYKARTNQDTVVNLTNHCYFNLGGQASGSLDDHIISIAASRYTPCGEGNIPTGDLASVDGTPLDLRMPTSLGDRFSHPMLRSTRGYDHNLVLDNPTKNPVAVLKCPATGIVLEVATTKPGIQLYSAGFLTPRKGKHGATYDIHHGVCLETQFFPDSPNNPHFPSAVLYAKDEYNHHTSYRFFAE